MNSEDKNKKTTPRYAFYGHHKCATTWITEFVNLVCEFTGMKAVTFHSSKQFHGNLSAHLKVNPVDFVSYTNAIFDQILPIGELRAFHVIRDPRDIVVSAYFSHLKTHGTKSWPELAEYRNKLQKLDKNAGLLEEIGYSESNLLNLSEWDYEQGHILELRFEELVINPYEVLTRAFLHLNLIDEKPPSLRTWLQEGRDRLIARFSSQLKTTSFTHLRSSQIPVTIFLYHVYNNSFLKKTKGRVVGVEDQNSHYRKGEPGDWRNHFTPAVTARFKERYPGLLVKLGYEKNDDW